MPKLMTRTRSRSIAASTSKSFGPMKNRAAGADGGEPTVYDTKLHRFGRLRMGERVDGVLNTG